MKIGITVWQDRVSPVLDTAQSLLIVEFSGKDEVSRQIVRIPDTSLAQRAQYISHTELELLICGAISRYLEHYLLVRGVEVIPWIGGPIDRVLAAYSHDQLEDNSFQLPGCFGRRRRLRCGPRAKITNRRGKNT
ncbi:MAG: hypothetical protein GY867_08295 [bacterium]|nr:hypothetical protein [bacterium]